ncbi:MAG: hypothetical protein SNJ52_00565 [Verrucomicrobiia bacterium]
MTSEASRFLRPAAIFILSLAVLTTTACTTLANRRDLYFPPSPEGHYTEVHKEMRRYEGRNVASGPPATRSWRHPFRYDRPWNPGRDVTKPRHSASE